MFGSYNPYGYQYQAGFGGYSPSFGIGTGFTNFTSPNYNSFGAPKLDGFTAPNSGTGFNALGVYGRFFSSPYWYGSH